MYSLDLQSRCAVHVCVVFRSFSAVVRRGKTRRAGSRGIETVESWRSTMGRMDEDVDAMEQRGVSEREGARQRSTGLCVFEVKGILDQSL